MKKIKTFNLHNFSLKGIHLIEASAGTGKTTTIVHLYLKILLGIKDDPSSLAIHFKVQKILIITFTNSAKKEIKNRIKKSIIELRESLLLKKTKNSTFLYFIKKIKCFKTAINNLTIALNTLDTASIFTIHSYYNYIINLCKLSIGFVFKNDFINENYDIQLRATILFWQTYCYKLSKEVSKIIFTYWKEPKLLLDYIKPWLDRNDIKIVSLKISTNSIVKYHKKLINHIKFFKLYWTKKNYVILEKYTSIIRSNKKNFLKNLLNYFHKITNWAISDTINYEIPKEIKYFKLTKMKTIFSIEKKPKFLFFTYVNQFLKKNFSLKEIFLFNALKIIPKFIKRLKEESNKLEFNDLEKLVKQKIINNKKIRALLRKRFPIAFIDEFQDVNYQQYLNFYKIYKNNASLILVGDPKQAIYSFQGSNLYSYLKVKSKIKNVYKINTNWRSSRDMIDSINILFSNKQHPFFLKQIVFFKSKNPKKKNLEHSFKINGLQQEALRAFFVSKENITLEDYKRKSAEQCAANINYLLQKGIEKKASLTVNGVSRFLKIKDIVILVRNKYESTLIELALKAFNIKSRYLSKQKSIFSSIEAKNLLIILKCILDPTNRKKLKNMIMSDLFSENIQDVYLFKDSNTKFLALVKKNMFYKEIWKNYGIGYLIQKIFSDNDFINLKAVYCCSNTNIRNYLHLGEILQKKFYIFNSKKMLLDWFKEKIFFPNLTKTDEVIKHNKNSNYIKIMSIHQSKGLEFSISWIPFFISSIKNKLCIFYDKKKNKFFIDINKSVVNLKKSREEQFSEEIRLFYVACTRSIFHCTISLASITSKQKKNTIEKTAIEYLLQKNKNKKNDSFFKNFKRIQKKYVIKVTDNIHSSKKIFNTEKKIPKFFLKNFFFNRKNLNTWNKFSYSRIVNSNYKEKNEYQSIYVKLNKKVEEDLKLKTNILNSHTFPKGKFFGLFLHKILKNYQPFSNFTEEKIFKYLKLINLNKNWKKPLTTWMNIIIHSPIVKNKCTLFNLNSYTCKKELQFYIPIKNNLTNSDFFQILYNSSYLNKFKNNKNLLAKSIDIKGFLKGVIDILFFFEGKFYIVDYKSNWLGETNKFYSKKNLITEMLEKNYYVQSIFYTLAVHRYLKIRIPKYKYKVHFGGVFYMFIRSINHFNQIKNRGILHTTPSFSVINKLNNILSGNIK